VRVVIVAFAWALLASGALVLAAPGGWLGPDVGTGFCEAARDCWMAQPVNTVSNTGFVLAGLAIGWHASRPARDAERRAARVWGLMLLLRVKPLGRGSFRRRVSARVG